MHPLLYRRPLILCASASAITSAIARSATTSTESGGTTRRCVQAIRSSHWSSRPYQTKRTFAASAIMANTRVPRFSAGVDEPALTRALEHLLISAEHGGRWALIPGGEGLERSFKFKTFAKTWDFMTAVSLQCKLKNHHPEWSNVYNTTYIRWTTHNPKGLSTKDVELATICDNLAKDFGEITEETTGSDSCALKQVADSAVTNAGDCCGPRK
ncbi:transcriptional coactivator/pterin dehydratase [Hypomontagnella monticulosa]|nr:transcriptional coactivator/pterin dehydratase [Hypomontagnella monticulosa]